MFHKTLSGGRLAKTQSTTTDNAAKPFPAVAVRRDASLRLRWLAVRLAR
jgi:hypothetical protein